jgi:hypothetical protein
MPGLLPIILLGSQLVLVADGVPQLNVEPSCRAASTVAIGVNRDEGTCRRDESAAHDKLQQQWAEFTPQQRSHCQRLSTLGGLPSYVELLTCLEMSKAAANLPKTDLKTGAKTDPMNGLRTRPRE